jgi:hypothetical protein
MLPPPPPFRPAILIAYLILLSASQRGSNEMSEWDRDEKDRESNRLGCCRYWGWKKLVKIGSSSTSDTSVACQPPFSFILDLPLFSGCRKKLSNRRRGITKRGKINYSSCSRGPAARNKASSLPPPTHNPRLMLLVAHHALRSF